MAETVGLIASIVTLVETTKKISNKIKQLRMNPERRSRLLKEAARLTEILKSAESMSNGAAELVQESLQEVKFTLEYFAGLRTRDRILKNILSGYCVMGEPEEAKLEEVEKELKFLRTQVVVVEQILQLKKDILHIYNGPMELPQSAGDSLLNRATPILTFLQDSKSEELRVIGVHGLPGVGKSTLLNYIWQEASSTAPFFTRAHVQIGHTATPQLLCSLQSSILQQLGGEKIAFTSPEGGRKKLSERFCQLRDQNKPVFLAIDNIFNADDLRNVLPSNVLAGLLPTTSCIAATCRNFRVLEALLNICSLDRGNRSQVFCYTPPCLDPEESREVFAKCGGLCTDKDTELLDNLVPLCKGLPLALTVLGKIFTGNANREREDWERIKEEMQSVDADHEAATMAAVTKSLQLSYEQLGKRRQAAFLDVVNFFYGWPWERVERIVGVSVLRDLKDSSLVSEADDKSKINQSAIRTGSSADGIAHDFAAWDGKVVTMHDLTLQFGEHLHTLSVTTMTDFQTTEGLLQGLEAPPKSLRNLMLWSPHPHPGGADAEVEFLEKTRSLQMLQLRATDTMWTSGFDPCEKIFKANHYAGLDVEGPQRQEGLRYLSLAGWKSSRRIMEMKVSREIREIHLYGCHDVEQLPDHAPLHQLEWLRIGNCERFQGFSSACVENWHKLKCLAVESCHRITSIPAELGHLESLRSVYFYGCSRLETFPSLGNAKGPSHLAIDGCPCLSALPTISCPLQTLELRSLPISSFTLETLALVHLQMIDLSRCHFEVLPISIYNASSLQGLLVTNCESLEELPDEVVGRLTSLTYLDISGCKKVKALPPAIGKLSSLQTLDLGGCESLEELPDEVVGRLTSLTYLNISGCKKVKVLPPAIGKLSSLQTLRLGGCESLEQLPDEVEMLTSLTKLEILGASM